MYFWLTFDYFVLTFSFLSASFKSPLAFNDFLNKNVLTSSTNLKPSDNRAQSLCCPFVHVWCEDVTLTNQTLMIWIIFSPKETRHRCGIKWRAFIRFTSIESVMRIQNQFFSRSDPAAQTMTSIINVKSAPLLMQKHTIITINL